MTDSSFHPTGWTLVLRARGGQPSRQNEESFRRRELALAVIKAPEMGGSEDFCGSDEEDVVAAIARGFGPGFGNFDTAANC